MDYIPVTSPSVFTTNKGDSLPTHSVFLSANIYGIPGGTTGTSCPPSVLNDPRAQNRSYHHAEIAWAANENAHNNVPAIEVSRSLDLSLASKNNYTKVHEPERWSYSDATMPTQNFRLQGSPRTRNTNSQNVVANGGTRDLNNNKSSTSQKRKGTKIDDNEHPTNDLTGTSHSRQLSSQKQKQRTFDDTPLPTTAAATMPSKPKTFEEILAENLTGVSDPSTIVPKSAELVGTQSQADTPKVASTSKKTFLKKNSRNWYKPAPRYRKKKVPKSQQKDSAATLKIPENTLPPPPPFSPANSMPPPTVSAEKYLVDSTLNTEGSNGNEEHDASNISTEMAFLSLLEKGKKDEQRELEENKRKAKSNKAQMSEAVKYVFQTENADEDFDAWGSVNERASATTSTPPQRQVSLRNETGEEFEVPDNTSINANENAHWQKDREIHENKHDTDFIARNDGNPSLVNKSKLDTSQQIKKKSSPMLQNLFHKKERERDAMRREHESRKRQKEKEMNAMTIKHLKADIEQFTEEIRCLKEERKRMKMHIKQIERKNATLRQEHVSRESQLEKERAKLEAWKSTEEKRLKRERRVFQRQARAQYQMPNRKDRQEIDVLKATISKLKLDIQKKDSKYRLNERRLKERNSELGKQIQELEYELKYVNEQVVADKWNNGSHADDMTGEPIQTEKVKKSKKIILAAEQRPKEQIHKKQKGQQYVDTNGPKALENDEIANNLEFSRSPDPVENDNRIRRINVNDESESVANERIRSLTSPIQNAVDLSANATGPFVDSNRREYNPNRYEHDNQDDDYDDRSTEQALSPGVTKRVGVQEIKTSKIIEYPDGKKEERFADGRRYIWFRNGTEKEITVDGSSTVKFGNGDVKTVDGKTKKIVYFYSKANTTHTTFPDGIEIFEFPNKQVEKHFPDGSKEIAFADGTKKYIYTDGQQLSVFPDGKKMVEDKYGNKRVLGDDDDEW